MGDLKLVLKGVALPEEFQGGLIVNDLAFSKDGKKYAAVTKDGLVTGDVPQNGKFEVDGTKVAYHQGKYGHAIRMESKGKTYTEVKAGNMPFDLPLLRFRTGHGFDSAFFGRPRHSTFVFPSWLPWELELEGELEENIEKEYANAKSVKIRSQGYDLELDVSPDSKAYVKGEIEDEPSFEDGKLSVRNLEGKVSIPAGAEVDIHVGDGNITGLVGYKGVIKSNGGDISLLITAPLEVEVKPYGGDCEVIGMVNQGKGKHVPPEQKPVGKLFVQSIEGDTHINYKSPGEPAAAPSK